MIKSRSAAPSATQPRTMTSADGWTSRSDSELTVDNVHTSLDSIKDDLWVAAACVDRILDDATVQRVSSTEATTEASLRRDALISHFNHLPADALILDRLDRLNTFVEMCEVSPEDVEDTESAPDAWEDDPWAESAQPETREAVEPPVALSVFLTDDLVRSAFLLASRQWFGALGIMFARHATHLWPYRIAVLDSIPEHAHPLSYRDFLPAVDTTTNLEKRSTSDPWRTSPDWSETLDVQAALAASGFTPDISLPSGDLHLDSRDDPLSSDELADWYKRRIQRIISSTGLIDIALAVVQHAAPQSVPGLDEMGEELSLLARLVYDAPQGEDDSDDDWTLDRWYSMDPIAVVRAYLAHSTPETLAKDIWRLVMPYLFVLESRAERSGNPDPTIRARMLYEYILNVPLETAAAIFEASKPILPTAQRIVQNDEDMARLALACLYGSSSLDEWPTMNRIFECLPAWDITRDDDQEDAADTTVVSLGAFVTPSTTRPRVPAPLRWFLQSNSDVSEQRSWANRMARRAGGSEDKLNTLDDWEWLLEDMLKLSGTGDSGLRGAFGLLSPDEVLQIFLSGLLSTGKALEDICLTCSRELYDNASSGNYTFGEMKLAYECLDVPPPSDRLLREKEFIEATSRLSSFNVMSGPGIAISPIEIRLTKDRLSLVSRVLSSNNDAYKHTEVILDLVHKLGLRNNVVAEVKTLAMLADTALQVEDFLRAYETSERMVETVLALRSSYMDVDSPEIQEASEVCWVACFQLGRQPEFEDVEKKLSLLGRALELCPPEKLHDVLVAWRRLENEDVEAREDRLSHRRDGKPGPRKAAPNAATSLRSRLQDFHMPSPPLLNTPDAAALASRTFRSVAANFPFSVASRGRSQASHPEPERSRSGSRRRDGDEISTQATRVFSKGIGWLIGADDE
ncbi:secretory pathway protein Sec39-domain-containing protein [Mycena rosella]|uniref:Secretory pathway protein Sec39-domain-containing protein n=1 Tax=Mycena rosella TaxID=1033263 RepID=A0AAD7GVT1_MYCRO|nr:secretory pathway protein Sec39-domain-containing protein [Mycena rosella]